MVMVAAGLSIGACGGGGQPEAGQFDPSIAEEFVSDKVIVDVQSDLSLKTEDLEEPSVACTQEETPPEGSMEEGVFTCDAEVKDAAGRTVGEERWEVAVELDTQTSGTVIRNSERVSSTIGEAPEPGDPSGGNSAG